MVTTAEADLLYASKTAVNFRRRKRKLPLMAQNTDQFCICDEITLPRRSYVIDSLNTAQIEVYVLNRLIIKCGILDVYLLLL